jgi:hypothetical protein
MPFTHSDVQRGPCVLTIISIFVVVIVFQVIHLRSSLERDENR